MSRRKIIQSFIFVLSIVWLVPESGVPKQSLDRLPDEEFTRLIERLSEGPGFFNSDNLVSNESSYLHILGKLKNLRIRDGVYLGVGPEQNFTYIAKTRPRLAIILDIRRQNLLYHLLFKALFEMSRNRLEYVSQLFCKPLPGKIPLSEKGSGESLIFFFEKIHPDESLFKKNLSRIDNQISKHHRFSLSPSDHKVIQDIYREFFDNQFEIRFRSFGRPMYRFYPSFREITLEKDLEGNWGNYLDSEEDFLFVKQLHTKNLIIPVVGDFAGPKTLKAIGDYIRELGETLSVFYVSNVEFYLMQNGLFVQYGENVKRLPISEKSLFIRAYFRFPHPERLPGYISATLLQRMGNFIEMFNSGQYLTYQDLGLKDYIGSEE
jgi:hypothetical protein